MSPAWKFFFICCTRISQSIFSLVYCQTLQLILPTKEKRCYRNVISFFVISCTRKARAFSAQFIVKNSSLFCQQRKKGFIRMSPAWKFFFICCTRISQRIFSLVYCQTFQLILPAMKKKIYRNVTCLDILFHPLYQNKLEHFQPCVLSNTLAYFASIEKKVLQEYHLHGSFLSSVVPE